MRRASTLALVAAWVAIGLAGAYSYLDNYYVHRGFATPVRLAGAAPGSLFTASFYSRALGRRADYMVYLPAGYTPLRRLPVLYLLHGIPGRPVAFSVIAHIEVRLDNLISRGRVPPMILIFPDGRIDGSTFSDSEWANTPSGRFDSYVADVVRDVDRRFASGPHRAQRVIGGLSAGGYGAINIALHHLNLFGNVQVWSGYFSQTHTGVFAHASRAQLAYNSPIDYARTLRGTLRAFPLRVFMFGGRSDPASRNQLAPMARVLRSVGADVTEAVYPGGHDWRLWNSHLDQLLMLAGADMQLPLRGPPTPRRATPSGSLVHHRARRSSRSHTLAVARGADLSTHGSGSAGAGGLVGGLLLALVSAAAINLGFLLQHQGLRRIGPGRGLPALIRAALRNPTWLGGQALGLRRVRRADIRGVDRTPVARAGIRGRRSRAVRPARCRAVRTPDLPRTANGGADRRGGARDASDRAVGGRGSSAGRETVGRERRRGARRDTDRIRPSAGTEIDLGRTHVRRRGRCDQGDLGRVERAWSGRAAVRMDGARDPGDVRRLPGVPGGAARRHRDQRDLPVDRGVRTCRARLQPARVRRVAGARARGRLSASSGDRPGAPLRPRAGGRADGDGGGHGARSGWGSITRSSRVATPVAAGLGAQQGAAGGE